MQGDDPREICPRNQNNYRQGDTGISVSGLLQPKAKRKQAEEKDGQHEGGKICSEIICLDWRTAEAIKQAGCRDVLIVSTPEYVRFIVTMKLPQPR